MSNTPSWLEERENENTEKQKTKIETEKKETTQTTTSHEVQEDTDGPQHYTSNIQAEVEHSYNDIKKRFFARKLFDTPQLYIDHIELFLALIEPAYNAEIQEAASKIELGEIEQSDFCVPKSNVNFHWQLTDDYCDTVNGVSEPNLAAAKALYGTVQDNIKVLSTMNARGSNPCIAINKIDGAQRQNTAVVAARAIWLEDDVVRNTPRNLSSTSDPLPLPPSFIVESSRGKYHYYWLTYTEDMHRWRRIQEEVMVPLLGSDAGANGPNRAMRVPGFWHRKKKPFPTRIVYLLGKDSIPVLAVPSEEFTELAKKYKGGDPNFAFEPTLASQVKRYSWEEIEDAFGRFLPEVSPDSTDYGSFVSTFDPVEAIEAIFSTENYHGPLHALCMHFANYQQDVEYVTYIVQGILCRIPDHDRDVRWNSRFNDVKRSATAAVKKKISELTAETMLQHTAPQQSSKDAIGLHSIDWWMPFPDITGACEPLDMLMQDFENSLSEPIKSFNFATIMSFFSVILQNIPLMPVMNMRTANGCHMMLSPSASGKDLNISQPLKQLAKQVLHSGFIPDTNVHARTLLSGITSGGEITSLSAFHNWASHPTRQRGAVWINTECTSLLGKMTAENNNVSNLTEVIINIQDGEPIIGVTKAKVKNEELMIQELVEAYSVLFAAQPASIKKYMTPELLYKGLIGRFDYYIPDRQISLEEKSTLSRENLRPYVFSRKTIEFLAWFIIRCGEHVEKAQSFAKRHVAVVYEDDEEDPLRPEYIPPFGDGLRRAKHVKWEEECRQQYQMDDPQFNTFLSRTPMSTERHLTILTAVQNVYEHYKENSMPFTDRMPTTDKILDVVTKLGEYQYKVRLERVWALFGSTRGLDEKHMAVLEAVKRADENSNRWVKYLSPVARVAYEHLFTKERFIPIPSVVRMMSLDVAIPTREIIVICQTLQAMGYIEYVASKQVDARISNKPVKNVVRLTAQGRL